jgi:hypothetical protein
MAKHDDLNESMVKVFQAANAAADPDMTANPGAKPWPASRLAALAQQGLITSERSLQPLVISASL